MTVFPVKNALRSWMHYIRRKVAIILSKMGIQIKSLIYLFSRLTQLYSREENTYRFLTINIYF
jgi:hypothetical protein